ncbi:VOC family protein [Streptomyces uncialis]|uniref:VOC family protein n=1 Tax=Streptomyces uncialis TaxID=1048205 RepID=UPI00225C2EF4|nr:VOC family protein [Streptomyces uncialis]MCX4659454.1 VOC family protein [Streptomyces uncialis]
MNVRFDLVSVVVSDMAASVAFYRRLGLAFPAGSETAPHAEAELPGGLRFALDTEETIRSFLPGFTTPSGDGRVGLAFLCEDGVDSVYEELLAAGYKGEHPPWDAPWGQRYALVLDPDGNSVDLFAPLG